MYKYVPHVLGSAGLFGTAHLFIKGFLDLTVAEFYSKISKKVKGLFKRKKHKRRKK